MRLNGETSSRASKGISLVGAGPKGQGSTTAKSGLDQSRVKRRSGTKDWPYGAISGTDGTVRSLLSKIESGSEALHGVKPRTWKPVELDALDDHRDHALSQARSAFRRFKGFVNQIAKDLRCPDGNTLGGNIEPQLAPFNRRLGLNLQK